MNEERQENTIQITEVLDLFVRSLRRVWWVCLLLIALCSALFGGYARVSYRPQYTASMTFLVNTGSGSAATAAQMAKTFPYSAMMCCSRSSCIIRMWRSWWSGRRSWS